MFDLSAIAIHRALQRSIVFTLSIMLPILLSVLMFVPWQHRQGDPYGQQAGYKQNMLATNVHYCTNMDSPLGGRVHSSTKTE